MLCPAFAHSVPLAGNALPCSCLWPLKDVIIPRVVRTESRYQLTHRHHHCQHPFIIPISPFSLSCASVRDVPKGLCWGGSLRSKTTSDASLDAFSYIARMLKTHTWIKLLHLSTFTRIWDVVHPELIEHCAADPTVEKSPWDSLFIRAGFKEACF